MRILTYNVAGMGAFLSKHTKGSEGFGAWLELLDVDIACMQETKLTRQKITRAEAVVPGYESFWAPSPASGFNGVAWWAALCATRTALSRWTRAAASC